MINEGRHSFARFEDISKTDQDLNEFLQKNFEKPDFKLKGVSSKNSQVCTAFYSTKTKPPSTNSKQATEEKKEIEFGSPTASDFQIPIIHSQLIILNKSFENDMIAFFNEFKSAKTKDKRKTYQTTFNQKEKDRVKRKWKEKMNQLQKHILFFDFLENHHVSKNVSKNNLNMLKKLDFVKEDKTIVRSSHPPLDIVIINYKGTEINASPFKFYEFIDANNPVSNETKNIIEQNDFVNNSLDRRAHV